MYILERFKKPSETKYKVIILCFTANIDNCLRFTYT